MKKAIGLLSLFGAVAICHPMAIAAPPTTSKAATQVLYASGLVTSGSDRLIDVSSCSQIRVTAEIQKEGAALVSLWDETSGGVGAAILSIPLGSYPPGSGDLNPPYASQVVETPGTSLRLYLNVYSDPATTAAVTIYCR
jgi:hypothetical protein